MGEAGEIFASAHGCDLATVQMRLKWAISSKPQPNVCSFECSVISPGCVIIHSSIKYIKLAIHDGPERTPLGAELMIIALIITHRYQYSHCAGPCMS